MLKSKTGKTRCRRRYRPKFSHVQWKL